MTPTEILAVQIELGHLSDTKLAAVLGVTRQTVGNWKKGRSMPVAHQRRQRPGMPGRLGMATGEP